MKKKNCFNCKHSEYEANEEEYSSVNGYFICNKRGDSEDLQFNLQLESYLEKAKVCCELK